MSKTEPNPSAAGVRQSPASLEAETKCLLAKSAEDLTRAPTEEEQRELHSPRSIEVNEVSLDRVWNDEQWCAEYRCGNEEVWFRDYGPRLEVVNREDESIAVALQIAAEKFGGIVTISGPAKFRARAVSLAAHLDIGVLEQDLSEDPEHEKGLIGAVEIEPGEASTPHEDDDHSVIDDCDLGR